MTLSTPPILLRFRYCPRCGSSDFGVRGVKSSVCPSCGFVYYYNPSSATALLVTDIEGRLLLATRAHDPARGTYDLPGGFVDADESLEEAALRELREETGIDLRDEQTQTSVVAPLRYLFSLPNIYVYSGFEVRTVDSIFHLSLRDLTPYVGRGQDDVETLSLVSIADLDPEAFGLTSISAVIRRLISDPSLIL